ncbi:MAG: hypothetical protein LUC94_12100 [Clostridiales bacterium]|nr:hypothetical protein [Clostridiales bacterium]
MRRKCVKFLALTLAVMMLPMSAYAAVSPNRTHSSSGGGGGGSSSSSSSTGSVVSTGTTTTSTTCPYGCSNQMSCLYNHRIVQSSVVTSAGNNLALTYTTYDNNGHVTGLVVDQTTSAGETIQLDELGDAVSQSTAVTIPVCVAERNDLPDSVKETINTINGGTLTAPGVNLNGYHAISGTIPVFLRDATTQEEVIRNTEVSLYVSSISESGVDAILFYNNHTQAWSLLTPTSVDTANNIVRFVVPCAGTTVMLVKD